MEIAKTIEVKQIENLPVLFAKITEGKDLIHYRLGFTKSSRTTHKVIVDIEPEKLILTIKSYLNPSRALLHKLKKEGEDRDYILLAPHIAEPLALDLQRKCINHADLNGRLFIKAPGILIDQRPGQTKYRCPTSDLDPFSLKTSRIVRVILSNPDTKWTQKELTTRTSLSRGLISQVVRHLIDEGYLKQTRKQSRTHPAHYQLINFDGLLDAWKEEDDFYSRVTIHQYSVLGNDPQDIADLAIDSIGFEHLRFTQWFAAWIRKPYTTPPVVSAYTTEWQAQHHQFGRKVSNGGNLWLIVPKDDQFFCETSISKNYPLVSDVQIYLDLLDVGQRGPEAAEELRKSEGFSGKSINHNHVDEDVEI